MSRFVRASKVRHVYCEAPKQERAYTDLRVSSATGDHGYIKANGEFFAFPVTSGGGALTVVPLSACGKLSPCLPVLDGHRGAVLDFDFNPFHEHVLASGGDDCSVKLWRIPQGGLTENLVEPLVNMAGAQGHQKKVSIVTFHPSASGILATGSGDATVKVWDAQRGECVSTCRASEQLVQDVAWSYDGGMLASSCKDKMMRVLDPRSGEVAQQVQAHDGAKTSKLVWLGGSGRLCSVGFTRSSKRQFKVWDPRALEQPLATCDIDQGSGALMPFFDAGTNVLYLAGKGDGNVRFYEMTDADPYQFHVGDFRGSSPARGMCMVPKRHCDVGRCEVARLLRLTKDAVEPLSFICPRKSDQFQADLFPDAPGSFPALSADDFVDGNDAPPVLASLDPALAASNADAADDGDSAASSGAFKTSRELEHELSTAKEYIRLLTGALQENNLDVPPTPGALAMLTA